MIPRTPIVRDSIVEVGDRDLQSDKKLFSCGEMSHTANAVTRETVKEIPTATPLHFPQRANNLAQQLVYFKYL